MSFYYCFMTKNAFRFCKVNKKIQLYTAFQDIFWQKKDGKMKIKDFRGFFKQKIIIESNGIAKFASSYLDNRKRSG